MMPVIPERVEIVRLPSLPDESVSRFLSSSDWYQDVDVGEEPPARVLVEPYRQIRQSLKQNGPDSYIAQNCRYGSQLFDNQLVSFAIGSFDGRQKIGDFSRESGEEMERRESALQEGQQAFFGCRREERLPIPVSCAEEELNAGSIASNTRAQKSTIELGHLIHFETRGFVRS